MTIAINLTNFITGACKDHIYEQFERVANSRPHDHFVFIVTKHQCLTSTAKNILFVTSGAGMTTTFAWRFWYDYTLPSFAKKYKASLLVNTDGMCSLRTKLAQCLFITDLSFMQTDRYFSKKYCKYLQKNIQRFLTKATTIIVSTDSLQNEITGYHNISVNKMVVVPISVSPYYKPLHWKEKEAAKDNLTEGKEYFLFSGATDKQANLINLLKAFSLFKKRQKSNMQLLITTRHLTGKNELIESLKSYKYRDEVKLLFDLPDKEVAKITAAAYAFVYPVLHESFPVKALQAIQCETPVILSDTSVMREITSDTATYVQPGDINDIAEKMMLLFKNETLRNEQTHKSKSLVEEYRQTNHAELLWHAITKCIEL